RRQVGYERLLLLRQRERGGEHRGQHEVDLEHLRQAVHAGGVRRQREQPVGDRVSAGGISDRAQERRRTGPVLLGAAGLPAVQRLRRQRLGLLKQGTNRG